MDSKTGLAVVLTSVVWLSACQPNRDPNVLILVIDALRPDHLGCYGYPLDTSPLINALAKRGVLFTDATSPSSYTRAAVPSIFASVHPGAHGVLTQGKAVEMLSDEYKTLAETLKERGYVTAAFAPNPSLNRSFNFDQGFDLYDDDFQVATEFETARRINERTLRWLQGNREKKPFFAYLHYRDVHAPYVPPPPYDRMFDKPGEGRALTQAEYESQPPDLSSRRYKDLDSYVQQYDGEIRYTDDHLGRFLKTLEKDGLLDNTVIFLTADHGESFLEHGSWTHGTGLYEELTHVPLLVVLPGEKHAGQRVEAPVQTTDIYPTVLELLHAKVPPEFQGKSLLDAVNGHADLKRPVFSEALVSKGHRPWNFGQLASVRSGGWKLIYNRWNRSGELYHLAEDPGETRNLVDRQPERARSLLRQIAAHDRETAKRSHRAKGQAPLSEDVVEGLRSLGYVR